MIKRCGLALLLFYAISVAQTGTGIEDVGHGDWYCELNIEEDGHIQAAVLSDDNKYVIGGSFYPLNSDDVQRSTPRRRSAFFACIDSSGQLLWERKTDLPEVVAAYKLSNGRIDFVLADIQSGLRLAVPVSSAGTVGEADTLGYFRDTIEERSGDYYLVESEGDQQFSLVKISNDVTKNWTAGLTGATRDPQIFNMRDELIVIDRYRPWNSPEDNDGLIKWYCVEKKDGILEHIGEWQSNTLSSCEQSENEILSRKDALLFIFKRWKCKSQDSDNLSQLVACTFDSKMELTSIDTLISWLGSHEDGWFVQSQFYEDSLLVKETHTNFSLFHCFDQDLNLLWKRRLDRFCPRTRMQVLPDNAIILFGRINEPSKSGEVCYSGEPSKMFVYKWNPESTPFVE